MRISIVSSDPAHPIRPRLEGWVRRHAPAHELRLVERIAEAGSGDVLFLIACHEIVRATHLAAFREAFVIHASDLPRGRGWSPYVWELLAGAEELTLTLLSPAEPVDSGPIWAKARIAVPRTADFDELTAILCDGQLALMDRALELVAAGARPAPQPEDGATHYPRRRPEDSALDPHRSIAEQFDLIRVSDPDRYPAHFSFRGETYEISMRRRRG